jgi:hypothetical protein
MLTWQHIHPGWNPGSLQEEHHLLVHQSLVSTPRIRSEISTHSQQIRNGIAHVKKERSGPYRVKLIFQEMEKQAKRIDQRNNHETWMVPSSPVKES